MSKILITGGTGCIGAVTVYKLLTDYADDVQQILVTSRTSNTEQLEIWFGDSLPGLVDSGKIQFADVDLGDAAAVQQAVDRFEPTRMIHLGALQSPACDATPVKGVEVNLTGTLNLFEMLAKSKLQLERFVFASSGAVYGKRAQYPTPTVPEDAQLAPPNLYGVWKVAGEHLASLFHGKTGVPTVSLRLNTTYGPGRDQGTTSAVTRIMKSVALGAHEGTPLECLMPYQGRENYHYVEDVGAHFAGVCMLPFNGCAPFNIKGKTIEVQAFLGQIQTVADELGLSEFVKTGIAEQATPNLFICDLDDSAIESTFPGLPRTPIDEGIRKTLVKFQAMAAAGRVAL